jgi:hypothetical protein
MAELNHVTKIFRGECLEMVVYSLHMYYMYDVVDWEE